MSGLKKLLGGGKKKSLKSADGKKTSSTGSLPGLLKSPSNISLSTSPIGQLGGYEVKEKDLSKLLKAAWQGDLLKLKSLSSKKANWDEHDKHHRTALHLAASRAYVEVIEFLLSVGANVNVNDGEGKTPLMKACEISATKSVETLLKGGAQTNVYDVNHVSPMHIASVLGNVDIGMLLYDQDAKIDAKDKNQITPLHLSCGLGHFDFAEFLISEYVAVDCTDNQRRTPLMAACIDGHGDIVKLLLENNADASLEDKDGKTAKQLAETNDQLPIATFIDEQSAKIKTSKQPLSPAVISNASKNSAAADLFSPTAQSLKEIFSSPGSSNHSNHITANVFGGPVMDVDDDVLSKTEASQSEDLDDNSWNDSMSEESETSKKPKGMNLSALVKNKNEENNNNSQPSAPQARDTPAQKSPEKKNPSTQPIIENQSGKSQPGKHQPEKHQPEEIDDSFKSGSDDDDKSSVPPIKLNLRKNLNMNKDLGSWADSGDSNSDWGDEEDDIENDFLQAMANPKKQENKQSKQEKQHDGLKQKGDKTDGKKELLQVPKSTPDIQLSTEFSDFDGLVSQPDESFSDLPLSDYNPPVNNLGKNDDEEQEKLLDTSLNKTGHNKENKEIEENESKWDDSSSIDIPSNQQVQIKSPVDEAKNNQPIEQQAKIEKSDDDFDWDSSDDNSLLSSSVGNKTDDDEVKLNVELENKAASNIDINKEKGHKNSLEKLIPIKQAETKYQNEETEEKADKPDIHKDSENMKKAKDGGGKVKSNENILLSMQPDDEDSEWDSEESSNESEERLNPQSPEPISDFDPSSPDESENDEFNINLENKANIQNSLKNVLDSGVLKSNTTNRDGKSLNDSNDDNSDSYNVDDDVEDEFLKQLVKPQSKQTPVKQQQKIKSLSSPRQQMADLGLDIGTSVSSVSDPECVVEEKIKNPNKKDSVSKKAETVKKKKGFEALGLTSSSEDNNDDILKDDFPLSSSSEKETVDITETESEWEIERKQSKRLINKKDEINHESSDKQKESQAANEITEHEARQLAHEQQLAAEIEDELRNELLDDINNVVFSSDDDFSLSENQEIDATINKNASTANKKSEDSFRQPQLVADKQFDVTESLPKKISPAMETFDQQINKDEGHNISEQEISEVEEDNISEGEIQSNTSNQSKNNSPDISLKKDASKDKEIKEKLMDILKRAKSPPKMLSSNIKPQAKKSEVSTENEIISPIIVSNVNTAPPEESSKITHEDLAKQQAELNEAIKRRDAIEKELEEKKEKMFMEEKQWRESLEKEELSIKEKLQKLEHDKNEELSLREMEFREQMKNLEHKKLAELEIQEKEKLDSIGNELELRQQELIEEINNKRKALEIEEEERLKKLEIIETERKEKLDKELLEMKKHIEDIEKERMQVIAKRELELKDKIDESLKIEKENKEKALELLTESEQQKIQSIHESHEKTLKELKEKEEQEIRNLEKLHKKLLQEKENEIEELENLYEEKKKEKEIELSSIENEKLENIKFFENEIQKLSQEAESKRIELDDILQNQQINVNNHQQINESVKQKLEELEEIKVNKENKIKEELKALETSLHEEFSEKEKTLLVKLDQLEQEHQQKLEESKTKLIEKQNEELLLNKSLDELRLQEKELRDKLDIETKQLELCSKEKSANVNSLNDFNIKEKLELEKNLIKRETEKEMRQQLDRLKFEHSRELEESKSNLEEQFSKKLKEIEKSKIEEIQRIETIIRNDAVENTKKMLETSFEEEQEKKLRDIKEASQRKQEQLEGEINSLKRLLEEQKAPESQVLQPIPVEEVVLTADKHNVMFSAPETMMATDEDDDEEVFEEIDVASLETKPLDRRTSRDDSYKPEKIGSYNIPAYNTSDPAATSILRNRNNALRNIDRLESTLKHERSLRPSTSSQRTSSPDNFLVVDFDKSGKTPVFNEMRREDLSTIPQIRPRLFTQDTSLIEDLQDELHESRRQLDSYREKVSGQEMARQDMKNNLDALNRKIESLSQSYNEQEKSKLDVELQLNSLRYKLEQETDAKNIAERLCNQLKDQLNRCEKKLTREAESRQNLDLSNRKLQSDLKSKDQTLTKLHSEITELQSNLDSERQSRNVQEELYEEHLKHYEALLFEAQKSNQHHAQAMSQLEVLSESRKVAEKTTDELKLELTKAKGDFTRTLSQLEETKTSCENKVNKLYEKLEKTATDLTTAEKSLFQTQYLLENEKAKKEAAVEKITMTLENEINARKRADEELISLRTRLDHAHRENERVSNEKNKCEAGMMDLKEMSARDKYELEKEVAIFRDQLKKSEEKLHETMSAMNSVKDELKKASHVLVEKNGETALAHKDFEKTRIVTDKLHEDLRFEKDNNSKLTAKLESSEERIKLLQGEVEKLQKEILLSKEQYIHRDRLASEKQTEISDHVMSMKDQFNKKLKETQKDLLTIESKNEDLNNRLELKEKEKIELETKIDELQTQMSNVEREKQRTELQNGRLTQELEKSKHVADEATQRLAKRTSDVDGMRSENLKLRGELDNIRKDNISMETTLREEKTRLELVSEDLRGANEARESLEKLLSNIKQNNVSLEEKLHSETLHRTQREREVEEHKGLWESEVKSRSKVGIEMLEKEKLIDQLKTELDNERRKTRRAIELKKGVDNKLEIYEQRSSQHQKETTALRSKLKQYQKRIKEYEDGNSRIPSLHVEFDKERHMMTQNVSKLRQQLDQLSNQLSHEQNMRSKAEDTNREQMKEINDLKTHNKVQIYEEEKLLAKCRSLETELEKQKRYYERNFIPQEEIEDFKKALETKARIDVNKKLQEVNMHLEEQSLAREAFEKLRSEKESKSKKELEETIQGLKFELSEVRTTLHEGLARRDTSDVEVKRFKELYKNERDAKDKLTDQLAKTAERLSLERSRANYLFDETIHKSKVTKRLFDEVHERDRMSLSPRNRGDNDLHPTPLLNPGGRLWSTPGSARSRGSPERDYLYFKQYANLLT